MGTLSSVLLNLLVLPLYERAMTGDYLMVYCFKAIDSPDIPFAMKNDGMEVIDINRREKMTID